MPGWCTHHAGHFAESVLSLRAIAFWQVGPGLGIPELQGGGVLANLKAVARNREDSIMKVAEHELIEGRSWKRHF
jgi:hypothetical protein